MDRIRAYTMIELVIVLALFAIVATIAVPKLTVISSYKENQELREFKRDILYARNQSIVSGTQHSIYLDYDTNSYIILEEDNVIKRYYFEYGVKLLKKPSALEKDVIIQIKFGRNGRPSTSGTIVLNTKDKTEYRLSVTPVTGKISLLESEGL